MPGRWRAREGEKLMGPAACGGERFKERAGVGGQRPMGAVSFRQQSILAAGQSAPATPKGECCGMAARKQASAGTTLGHTWRWVRHIPHAP